jgi:hypothetical protein
MKIRTSLAAVALTATALVGVSAVTATAAPQLDRHACTRTSSGHCIKGGQLCPQSKYGHSGWDAKGRRYVCKGDHSHPHWMKP